jgi:hypothetical protein
MENSCFGVWSCIRKFFKHGSRIEKLRIKFLGSFEASANNKNLSGDISTIRNMYGI